MTSVKKLSRDQIVRSSVGWTGWHGDPEERRLSPCRPGTDKENISVKLSVFDAELCWSEEHRGRMQRGALQEEVEEEKTF